VDGRIISPMSHITDTIAANLATGIPPARMRHWLRRGKLTRHGTDPAGRTLIDLDELIACQAQLDQHAAANPAWDIAACGSRKGVSH